MGNKNARGRTTAIRAAQAYYDKKAADRVLAEQREVRAKAQQLSRAQQKALARQHAFNFNYDTLPKHSALKVIKDFDTGTVKFFIDFDIIYPKNIANDANLLIVLPRYAELITKVEFRLVAPTRHGSPEIMSMMKTINCLNKFDIDEFQFVVSLNKPHSFSQLKLAAAAFGLNFKNWTMVTEVRNFEGRSNVDIGSRWDRRLACIYKERFLIHKEL